MTVKAGKPCHFNVQIFGEEPPQVFWFKMDNSLEGRQEISIEVNKNENTILSFKSPKRSDCGPYTLKLKNSVGEEQGTAELTVLDKPTPPQGPLDVSEVFEDNCKLSWNAPLDDGGQPVDHYELERLDEKTGHWMPAGKTSDTSMKVTITYVI